MLGIVLQFGMMSMKAIKIHVYGKVLAGNGRFALLLLDENPKTETADSLYLRFPFVLQGSEEPVFPAFLLDDWGGEVKGVGLYQWFVEYSAQFPRAELFGFTLDGSQNQFFLRELEIYARLPCYVYSPGQPEVTQGILVNAVLLPDPAATTPQKIKRPLQVKRPFALARLSWWQVPPQQTSLDFLSQEQEVKNRG